MLRKQKKKLYKEVKTLKDKLTLVAVAISVVVFVGFIAYRGDISLSEETDTPTGMSIADVEGETDVGGDIEITDFTVVTEEPIALEPGNPDNPIQVEVEYTHLRGNSSEYISDSKTCVMPQENGDQLHAEICLEDDGVNHEEINYTTGKLTFEVYLPFWSTPDDDSVDFFVRVEDSADSEIYDEIANTGSESDVYLQIQKLEAVAVSDYSGDEDIVVDFSEMIPGEESTFEGIYSTNTGNVVVNSSWAGTNFTSETANTEIDIENVNVVSDETEHTLTGNYEVIETLDRADWDSGADLNPPTEPVLMGVDERVDWGKANSEKNFILYIPYGTEAGVYTNTFTTQVSESA